VTVAASASTRARRAVGALSADALRTLDDGERTVLGRVVSLAFLVRLLALLAALIGLVGSELTPQMLITIVVLGGTSFLGLSSARALEVVVAHPILALADVLVVIVVLTSVGVQNPLVLATLSTALLVGVLFRTDVCILIGAVLVLGYVAAATFTERGGVELGFFLSVGVPATYVCLLWIGHAFRRISTAQRLVERELASMRQNAAIAEERSRLAREVHDSLAKSLQGVALGAAALPTWLDRDSDRARQQARELARGAQQAVSEARSLLVQMRTDDVGEPFSTVLQRVAAAWGEEHGRAITTTIAPIDGLDAAVRYELLASVREALENVHRHAPSSRVELTARQENGTVLVEVVDDGPGVPVELIEQREREGHFGLLGMRERMAGVGGSCTFSSAPSAGTTVALAAPRTDPHLLPWDTRNATSRP
jgi:signal transduction histidine kinase